MRHTRAHVAAAFPLEFTTGRVYRRRGADRPRLGPGDGVLTRASGRPFSDFLQHDAPPPPPSGPPKTAEEKAQELIERTAAVLVRAEEALNEVRQREPSDSRHRRSGPDVIAGPVIKTTSADPNAATKVPPSSRPAITALPLAWESDTEDEDELFAAPSPPPSSGGGAFGGGGGGGGGGGITGGWAPGGLDTWFGDKVDTGGVALRPAVVTPTGSALGVAVMDRPNLPTSLEFAPSDGPGELGATTIFPSSIALRFQSDADATAAAAAAAAAETAPAAAPEGEWERTSGEEFGPNGYWYRWTEVTGRDATGAVAWSERWWEASDWRGMKELGAEKWGHNANGDAWRESWRESIGFDEATGQPSVERSAHKWARAAGAREWEEKWGESYLSGGKAEKWADKWGREGTDVWHERWGESYDGAGGCVKWTDRWAERPPPPGTPAPPGGLDKWGEKWEERFGDGKGTKRGETWTESAAGERYQRWWGENHEGGGMVQKFGHSTTGEHWDVTEQMDTYYNPIPHFGYDLALAHSPQLRGVPMVPRDGQLGGEGEGEGESEGKGKKKGAGKKKGGGGGGGGGGGDDLSSLFG